MHTFVAKIRPKSEICKFFSLLITVLTATWLVCVCVCVCVYVCVCVCVCACVNSIITVILKINSHLYYLLTNSLLYCEILFKARRFELQTELARSMCKR